MNAWLESGCLLVLSNIENICLYLLHLGWNQFYIRHFHTAVASHCFLYKYFLISCPKEFSSTVSRLHELKHATRLGTRSHRFNGELPWCNPYKLYSNSCLSRNFASCFPAIHNIQKFKCNINGNLGPVCKSKLLSLIYTNDFNYVKPAMYRISGSRAILESY